MIRASAIPTAYGLSDQKPVCQVSRLSGCLLYLTGLAPVTARFVIRTPHTSYPMELLEQFGPVTAVQFIPDRLGLGQLLLFGQGNELKLLDCHSGTLRASCCVFSRNIIHGISVGSSHIACWGSRSLAFIPLASFVTREYTGKPSEYACNDWISCFAFGLEDTTAYILNAHNVLITITFDDSFKPRYTAVRHCGEKSILYSGTIRVLRPSGSVLVGAGTVISGAIVWNPDSGHVTRFEGHEGSIFSVFLSEDGSRVLTCSDDRSVRMWDCQNGTCLGIGWGHTARIWSLEFIGSRLDKFVSASEDATAKIWSFSPDSDNPGGSETGKIVCSHTFTAHLGKNCWAATVNPAAGLIATGGQDGRVRLFPLPCDPANAPPALRTPQSSAADGSLVRGTLLRLPASEEDGCDRWSFADSSSVIPAALPRNTRFKHVAVIGSDTVVAATATGTVLSLFLPDLGWRYEWSQLRHSDIMFIRGWRHVPFGCVVSRHGSVTIVEATPRGLRRRKEFTIPLQPGQSLHNVLLGSGREELFILFDVQPGMFWLYSCDETKMGEEELEKMEEKTESMEIKETEKTESSDNGDSSENVPNSHISVNSASPAAFESPNSRTSRSTPHPVRLSSLPQPPAFRATSFTFCATLNCFLIGSRIGTITCVPRPSSADSPAECPSTPHTWRQFGDDAITHISVAAEESGKSALFLVTCRAGAYWYIRVAPQDPSFQAETLHENRIPRGTLEGSARVQGDLWLFGFRADLFCLHNETRNAELFSQSCGGAHRSWDFVINRTGNLQLFFIRDGSLFRRVSSAGQPTAIAALTAQPYCHGRELRAIAAAPREDLLDSGAHRPYRLLATGAEDTRVHLGRLYNDGTLENLWELRRHVSGLQEVRWADALTHPSAGQEGYGKPPLYLLTSSAREELFVWRIVDTRAGPMVACVAETPVASRNPDLRVMAVDSLEAERKETGKQADNGTEVNVAKPPSASSSLLISAVYSDSTIKLWRLNKQTHKIDLLVSGRYRTCCLLRVALVCAEPSPNGHRVALLATATDGKIAVWDLGTVAQLAESDSGTPSELPPPASVLSVHQSGVKALAVLPSGRNVWSVVTGGDDNALAVTKLSYSDGSASASDSDSCSGREGFVLTAGQKIEAAASSTISDVAVRPRNSGDGSDKAEVVVVSVDQAVRRWEVRGTELTLVEEKYTTVADTGCVECTEIAGREVALVGGAGLSSWRIAEVEM